MSVPTSSSSPLITSGEKWKAPRPFPAKLVALSTVAVVVAVFAAWWLFIRPTPEAVVAVDVGPVPEELSAVTTAGVSSLLNQFTSNAREIRGEINDGELKAKIITSVTADGKYGFGTLNAANIDGQALLADGEVFLKGSATFWSALGIQSNVPEWVRVHPDFFGSRIFYPAQNVTAALTPVEDSRINGDEYIANDKARATFGFNGLESVSLPGYNVTVMPANNDGVFNTAKPQRDAVGDFAVMDRAGTAWTVSPPPPPPAP